MNTSSLKLNKKRNYDREEAMFVTSHPFLKMQFKDFSEIT